MDIPFQAFTLLSVVNSDHNLVVMVVMEMRFRLKQSRQVKRMPRLNRKMLGVEKVRRKSRKCVLYRIGKARQSTLGNE